MCQKGLKSLHLYFSSSDPVKRSVRTMQGLNAQAPVRFFKVLVTIATLVCVTSSAGISRAEADFNSTSDIEAEPSPTPPGSPNTAPPLPNAPDLQPIEPKLDQFIEPKFCQSDLQTGIQAIVEAPRFRTAQWGILIKPISEGNVLYQHNPDLSLIPASNIKLLTTAAALQIFSDRDPAKLPSLSRRLTIVNRYSDNNEADSLLRSIGGQSAARNALASLGVNVDGFRQVDGSGLSRSNRATPSTLVTVLEKFYAGNVKTVTNPLSVDLFYDSLAIAGVNGTLRHRFQNTPVQGRLHGKTGTLRGVRALSGYLENDDYGIITFSIVVNQPGQSGQVLLQAIDQIVLQTAKVTHCD